MVGDLLVNYYNDEKCLPPWEHGGGERQLGGEVASEPPGGA